MSTIDTTVVERTSQPSISETKNVRPWHISPDIDQQLIDLLDQIELENIKHMDLPGDDGDPMENNRERIQINLGIDSINHHWQHRQDYFVGGNMFVYFHPEQAREIVNKINEGKVPTHTYRGPDMFIVTNIDGSYTREKWVVWNENDHYPDIIFEYLSPSTRRNDFGKKKDLYEQVFKTREYFCFEYMNPTADPNLFGWRLDTQGRYQPLTANEQGWLWSEELNLWVGTWDGKLEQDTTTWMRFYTANGDLVLTGTEAERQKAEAERQKAEAERQKAEEATQRADEEARQRQALEAEIERLKAQLAAS